MRNKITILLLFAAACRPACAQNIVVRPDAAARSVFFGNKKLSLTLVYDGQAKLSAMTMNGRSLLADEGVCSEVRTGNAAYSSRRLLAPPVLAITPRSVTLAGIRYGDRSVTIDETWTFSIDETAVRWTVRRSVSKPVVAEKIGWPAFVFAGMDTWEGAYTDYGGLAWFYLFNKPRDTYGVHAASTDFWNSKTGAGLTVRVSAPGRQVAMDYSRTANDRLAFNVTMSAGQPAYRFDSATHRRRYVRDTTDVWAPAALPAGAGTQTIVLAPFDFEEKYGRGRFAGIDGAQVSAVLNTIARIGVIDKKHFGGNSWHTPYGPICLHEQYIAQLGLAIDDPAYLRGYRDCLDFYRDNAIRPDGRVWPRWAYSNEDAMPGQYTDEGFYEAQWGYLLDSNPDYVTNVSELYEQNGDLGWVRSHAAACEKALDWILRRDTDDDGLVEMMTDSYKQRRGSDWIDIIWAAHENAFVNAKLYHALQCWSSVEDRLGASAKADRYRAAAAKLRAAFNKPVAGGGFWDADHACYIHWRDKDGSLHGRNTVIPVNFMAIAYGICDDEDRRKIILDSVEAQMEREKLFFWPLCMTSYGAGEGNDWQFPFPAYENGDIFLSWGSVAIKAYAAYKPALALQYVKNVLAQYAKDGLAFQRYGRAKQDGLGDDILSGNSLSVVGLYQAIYGINPRHNRFYLDPHLAPELSGTRLRYRFRGRLLGIGLDTGAYTVSDGRFAVATDHDFGFFAEGGELRYFDHDAEKPALQAWSSAGLALEIGQWQTREILFSQTSAGDVTWQVNGLRPGGAYVVRVGAKASRRTVDASGRLRWKTAAAKKRIHIRVTPA